MKNKPSPLQKRSKYTNLPFSNSEKSKKPNFGSNSIQRKPISLHPVKMEGESDSMDDEYEI
jgi:hypothetical protein